MLERENVVGQNVICVGSGIGQIVDVTPLHEGGELFYKVSFPENNCINYLSLNNNSSYRMLSSKNKVQSAIELFNSKFEKINYGTIQNKINLQNEMLKTDSICDLAKSLSILNNDKELHAQVSKSYKEALASFIDEVMFVLDIEIEEAYKLIGLNAPKRR